MTSFLRRFSLSSSTAEADDPSISRRSSGSTTARIYGARDYKLAVKPATEQLRRKSIVEDYSSDANDTGSPTQRRHSVPYGPRHFQLAVQPASEQMRRKSIVDDYASTVDDAAAASAQRRYSVPYGSRHYQYATTDEAPRKDSV